MLTTTRSHLDEKELPPAHSIAIPRRYRGPSFMLPLCKRSSTACVYPFHICLSWTGFVMWTQVPYLPSHPSSSAPADCSLFALDSSVSLTAASRSNVRVVSEDTQASHSREPVSAARISPRQTFPTTLSPGSESPSSGHTPPRLFALGTSGSDNNTLPRKPLPLRKPVSERERFPNGNRFPKNGN